MREWKSLIQMGTESVDDDVLVEFQVVNLRSFEEFRPTVTATFSYSGGYCYRLKVKTEENEVLLDYSQIEALEHFFKEYGTMLYEESLKVQSSKETTIKEINE